MGNTISVSVSVSAAAATAVCAAISAVEFVYLLDPQPGAGTMAAAQAPALRSALRDLLLLAAATGLSATVAFMHRYLHHAGGVGAGVGGRVPADNRRLSPSELFVFILCALAATIEFFIFVQPAGGAADRGDQVRALGQAALLVLPAASTATFFLGILLVVVGHIRAGGEGGGGGVAGYGPIEAPVVGLLAKTAVAAAAALVFLMAVAIYGA